MSVFYQSLMHLQGITGFYFFYVFTMFQLMVLLPLARYSWCSERVIQDSASTEDNVTPDDLIPLESNSGVGSSCTRDQHPALVIGHNVGFDRSFVKEQYWLQVYNVYTTFHICTWGRLMGVGLSVTQGTSACLNFYARAHVAYIYTCDRPCTCICSKGCHFCLVYSLPCML